MSEREWTMDRKGQREALVARVGSAAAGHGSATILVGEAGIGKSTLARDVIEHAQTDGFEVIHGFASHESAEPLAVFTRALKFLDDTLQLFEQDETRFANVLAIDPRGDILAQSSSGDAAGAERIATTLSAVQGFVKDSFASSGGLGRLEFGTMKVLVERGKAFSLVGLVDGDEHPGMRESLRRAIGDAEGAGENGLASAIETLAMETYLTRRDLSNVKLESERAKIAERILTLIAGRSQSVPVLLVLEDVHWADEPSLYMLEYLVRNIAAERVAVLCTARPPEKTGLAETIGRLKGEETAIVETLSDLSEEEVSEMLASMLDPHRLPPSFVLGLARRCRGNPLFVKEIVSHMLGSGAIQHLEGGYTLLNEDYEVPGTLEEVLRMRVSALAPDALLLAELASCNGREFSTEPFLDAAGELGLAGYLSPLTDSKLISVSERTSEFSHALVADFIYGGISPRWKRRFHGALGIQLEKRYLSGDRDTVFDLARHFHESGDFQKSLDYSTRAGETAEASFAIEQAARHFSNAVEAFDRVGKDVNAAVKVHLLDRLATLQSLTGNQEGALSALSRIVETSTNPADKAKAHRRRAAIHTLRSDFDSAERELALGEALAGDGVERWLLMKERSEMSGRRGDYVSALELSRRALDGVILAEAGGRETASATTSVGKNLYCLGHYDEALETYGKSLAYYRSTGDEAGAASLLMNMAIVKCDKGDIAGAIRDTDEALAIAERRRDLSMTARAYGNLCVFYQRKGDYRTALDHSVRSLDLFRRLGDAWGVSRSSMNIGVMYLGLSDFTKAHEFFERSLEVNERLGNSHGVAMSIYFLAGIHMEMGDLEKALEMNLKSMNLSDECGDRMRVNGCKLAIAEIYRAMGLVFKSEVLERESLEEGVHMGDAEVEMGALCGLSDSMTALGKAEEAVDLARRAMERAASAGMESNLAAAHRCLGSALAAAGDGDGASSSFAASVRIFREQGSESEAAKALYFWGVSDGDWAKIAEALAVFSKLGLVRMERIAREKLASMDAVPKSAA